MVLGSHNFSQARIKSKLDTEIQFLSQRENVTQWTDQKLTTFKELIADCYKNHTERKYTLWESGENFILYSLCFGFSHSV